MDADRLREALDYDPATGVFTWKLRVSTHCYPGDVAGSPHKQGYTVIGLDRRVYLAHRLAWLYVYDEWPECELDHINTIKTDNRIANLRPATSAENKQNQRVGRGSSRYLGVTWSANHNRWKAQIGLGNKKTKYLGLYDTEEEAHAAYLTAKADLHPFSMLGGASSTPR